MRSWTRTPNSDRPRPSLHGLVFALAMLSIALNSANAYAPGQLVSGMRIAKAVQKFDEVRQVATIFNLRPPRRLHSRHLELAVGGLSTRSETRAFVSLGPVWQLQHATRPVFLELGFSPTIVGGSTLNGRDLGGNFHFTSSVTLGATFGAQGRSRLALRFQHTSNGGLSSHNPGLDAVALDFTIDIFGR